MGLVIEDLAVEYVSDGFAVRAVDGLSFEAKEGQLVLLLGPSGSGKTSVLSCLAGILTPTAGRIMLDETAVSDLTGSELTEYRRSTVGVVFQAFNLLPSATALENVAAPLLVAGTRPRRARDRARQLLDLVGMTDRAGHRPGKLSGGQQQRVAVARALAHDPPLLIADEPTANLDYINAEAIIRLLGELRDQGRIIIVSTHDERLVPIADAVVQMVPDFHASATKPQQVAYAAGETIFEQGSRGQLVYTVEKGKVEIVRILAGGDEEPVATVGPGRYFGELGPMLGFPRSATARAKTDVVLTAYGVREFRAQVLDGGSDEPPKPRSRRASRARATSR